MTIKEIKYILPDLENLTFQLENGTLVPLHFHVTEIGLLTKNFIDCGGTVREEKLVTFQLWNDNDFEHRLAPIKLLNIIALGEQKLGIQNLEIEVEYQTETIGKFGLDFKQGVFILSNKKTNCLAKDKCGISAEKLPQNNLSCCSSNSNCC